MNGRISKKDTTIIIAMTIIYLIIALFYLGDHKAPQTGWKPEHLGESFIVDFGKEVTIDKILLFGGLGNAWGCFGSLEIEAWQNDNFVPYSFIDMNAVFRWHYTTDKVATEKLRFTTRYMRTEDENDKDKYFKAEYREIGFFSGNNQIKEFSVNGENQTPGIEAMFDEQHLVPERPSVLNSTTILYFPRTALEQLEKKYSYETPILAKPL